MYRLPFRLPVERNRSFVGRKAHLQQIKDQLHSEHSCAGSPPSDRVVILYGLGGMGKTQLALKYAAENAETYSAVLWINASNERNAHLGFRDTAKRYVDAVMDEMDLEVRQTRLRKLRLGRLVNADGEVSLDQAHLGEITKSVIGFLERDDNDNWLLILDNVDDVQSFDITKQYVIGAEGLLEERLLFDRPDRTQPVISRARRLAVVASIVWGASALLSIVALSVELDPTRTPSPASVWSYVTNIAAGKGLLMSAGCALLSWWICRVSVRHGEKVPAELRIGIALFGLLPLPLTGHAANWYYHDLSMISMELHVVAATAWAGGLAAVVIFLSREPSLLAEALPRFSRLATWCVFIVGITGILNGLLELALSPVTHLPWSIFSTRYGVLLLAKAACMAVVAVLAIHVRTRIVPAVAQRKRTAVALWCGWEVITLGVAFGVAVVLTRASVTPF